MAGIWSSERLIYRAVEDSDWPLFQKLSSNPENLVNATRRISRPQSSADAKGWSQALAKDAIIGVVICLRPATAQEGQPTTGDDEPIPIGNIDLKSDGVTEHHRFATIGVNILTEYQNKGYGGEAIKWVLRWGFEYGNLHRIEISAFEYNIRAVHLYEKLGFKIESRARSKYWYKGRYWGDVGMAILEDEWRELYGSEEQ